MALYESEWVNKVNLNQTYIASKIMQQKAEFKQRTDAVRWKHCFPEMRKGSFLQENSLKFRIKPGVIKPLQPTDDH